MILVSSSKPNPPSASAGWPQCESEFLTIASMRPAFCNAVLRSCDRPHSSHGVSVALRASSNFHLPCGKQSFGVGLSCLCCFQQVPRVQPSAPSVWGRNWISGSSAQLVRSGQLPIPIHMLSRTIPSFRVCPAVDPTATSHYLQMIFGIYARLSHCGFLEVLPSSAFFRNTRRFVPRSRNRHSSSGFSINCGSCRQEAFTPPCQSAQFTPPSWRFIARIASSHFSRNIRSWGLERPSKFCSSRRSVRNFLRLMPACCFSQHPARAFYGTTETLGRNFRAFIPSWKL